MPRLRRGPIGARQHAEHPDLRALASDHPGTTRRTRWAMRWKPALNAFAFGGRFPAAEAC